MSHTALKLIQLHRMNDLKQKIVVIWMGCPLCISITLFSVKCYPVTFFFPLIPGQGNVLRENKSMKLCLKIQINDSDTTPALTLKGTANELSFLFLYHRWIWTCSLQNVLND